MRIKSRHFSIWLAVGALTPLTASAAPETASGEELEEELRFLKAETYVVTASKIPEKTEKSVATVTVISERQIHQMGARNLLDILRIVPGLGIAQSSSGMRQLEVRGVMSTYSERVLIMLNGHPVDHNLFWGGSMWTYDDLPIDNVKRVEVVRGPGSALYGANAFLATVNIITKDAGDVDGAAAAIGGGSFDTQQYNALAGKQKGEWHALANFNYSTTDGIDAYIQQDALKQSGDTNLYERRRDLEWKLGYGKKAVFDGRFIHKTAGTFTGPSGFLSSDSARDYDDYFLRFTSEHDVTDDLKLTALAYHSYFQSNDILEFRPNEFHRIFFENLKTGGGLQGTYRFSASNTLIAGAGYESQVQENVRHEVGPTPSTLNDFAPFTQNVDRQLWSVYVQDLWDLTDNLRLIAGARYDQYSDFGGTFNPRMGFNWEFAPGYAFRFSYGTAFRAPTFAELYATRQIIQGDPDLSPEEVETYEVGLNAKWTARWSSELTLFRNDISDMIGRQVSVDAGGLPSVQYANLNGIESEGIEVSSKYLFAENTYIAANYTFQSSHFIDTGIRVHDTPEHRGTFQGNVELLPNLQWYGEVQIKGPTTRASGDPRAGVAGYALVNTTLRAVELLPGLEVNFSVFNLLDKKTVTPFVAVVPDDFPQAERTFFAKLRYEIK